MSRNDIHFTPYDMTITQTAVVPYTNLTQLDTDPRFEYREWRQTGHSMSSSNDPFGADL